MTDDVRPHKATVNRALYLFIRTWANLLFRTIWRMKVVGAENVPRMGPLIVAPNHRSYFDPPLAGASVPREIHFLAKQELFRFRPFGWFITNLNAHPLNRGGGDVAAFRTAIRILRSDGALIMFPEGRRIDTDALGPAKPGIGMLAASTGAPIVPVYIHNSRLMVRFKRVEVRFGKPIDPRGFASYADIAAKVMDEIAAMKAARQA